MIKRKTMSNLEIFNTASALIEAFQSQTEDTHFPVKGQGQIEIEVNGQLSISDAINLKDEEIMAFDQIKVVKVENEIMYIEKV